MKHTRLSYSRHSLTRMIILVLFITEVVKMITKDTVKELIAKNLNVSLDVIQDDLAVGDIPEWDSLAHMRIIAALETDLGVVLDIEQTLEIEDVEDIVEAVTSHK